MSDTNDMSGTVLTRLYGNEDYQKFGHCGVANGYVGVFEGHPWYGVHYDDLTADGVYAHGGLSYSQMEDDGIRRPVWWVGFDTRHLGDNPAIHNWNYVGNEVRRLKDQALSALSGREIYRWNP